MLVFLDICVQTIPKEFLQKKSSRFCQGFLFSLEILFLGISILGNLFKLFFFFKRCNATRIFSLMFEDCFKKSSRGFLEYSIFFSLETFSEIIVEIPAKVLSCITLIIQIFCRDVFRKFLKKNLKRSIQKFPNFYNRNYHKIFSLAFFIEFFKNYPWNTFKGFFSIFRYFLKNFFQYFYFLYFSVLHIIPAGFFLFPLDFLYKIFWKVYSNKV